MRALLAKLERGNMWLADRITAVVGSMWCAYAFALITLVSLPAVIAAHDIVVLIQWVGSVFLQLVLLPIIMVGQAIQQQKHDALAEQHQDLAKQHANLQQQHAEVLAKVTDIHQAVVA